MATEPQLQFGQPAGDLLQPQLVPWSDQQIGVPSSSPQPSHTTVGRRCNDCVSTEEIRADFKNSFGFDDCVPGPILILHGNPGTATATSAAVTVEATWSCEAESSMPSVVATHIVIEVVATIAAPCLQGGLDTLGGGIA